MQMSTVSNQNPGKGPRDAGEAARCERLAYALDHLSLPQEEVAARLRVTASHLSGVKTGKRRVSRSLAYKMQEAFGIEARWIIQGTGPIERRPEGDVQVVMPRSIPEPRMTTEFVARVTCLYACDNCGQFVPKGAATCPRCAASLDWDEIEPQPPSDRL